MSSSQNNEGEIRRRMVEGDVVECMVALPPQLFLNTQIPACLWFLTCDKTAHGRDRRREFLFIDARKLGQMETRVHRVFSEADIALIADTPTAGGRLARPRATTPMCRGSAGR
jgi:type I restriction enzyme M protein